MLLQQSSPGPSPRPSPKPNARLNGSPSPRLTPPARVPGSPSSRGTGSPSVSDAGSSPRFGRGESPRTWRRDEEALQQLQRELKDGWTVHTGRDGRLYYCNHVTRTASWLPPAECWTPSLQDDLPYGWERAMDSNGEPYYINHLNKTTTHVAPEGGPCESPPAPRDVVLRRDPALGFGFVAGSERPVLVRFVTDNSPSVGKLEPGDQILSVNGEDVSLAAREHVIAAVRACADSVTLRVCQPARAGSAARRSALLSAAKRAQLRQRPPRVRFADSVQVNGAPLYPPSAFSLGDLCLPPMANVLKVFLENGQTKSFKYDSTTTVADVVTSLKDKLCITADEHFSLVVEHIKGMKRNKLTLLDPKETLARIASRPGAHKLRCLYRAVFPPASPAALAARDPAALDYLYMQCCNDVAQERFSPELTGEAALRLGALHALQLARHHALPSAKLNVKGIESEFGLERFVCGAGECRRKDLRRQLQQHLKLALNANLTQLELKLRYVEVVSTLPSYGAKCYCAARPPRLLLVSPRAPLAHLPPAGPPQTIATYEEISSILVRSHGETSADVSIFLDRDRVLALNMDERDAREMPLVIAGYYKLETGKELNVEIEREPITEDIAPPYLSQHNVVPAKWSYLNYDDPTMLSKKHYAIFSMPPPYHSTPEQAKSNLDTNMNTNINNRNHSNNSSPLIGYDANSQFDKCKVNDDFKLFDDSCYIDDGMGFDLQSVLSIEMLENVTDPRLVEAKNEEVLRRVAEMQKLVENSQQYLTEHGDIYNDDMTIKDEFIGRETSVDQGESDNESNHSRMSTMDDAPGILKHSDSLLLLTETINQGVNSLDVTLESKNDNNSLTQRQSQGLSTILNNCGFTDALQALSNDLSQSESDNESLYTPTNSPIRKYQNKPQTKAVRTSFGLHSPDNVPQDSKEGNLKEYLKQLREKRDSETKSVPTVEVGNYTYEDDVVEADAELIDLTLIPPPQTPDELDAATQVPQMLPVVPPSFADDRDSVKPEPATLEEFIANVTIQPPTVKVTPAIELTPEEILSYIIPPPPGSNSSTLDRDTATYVNQKEIQNKPKLNGKANGEIMKGTLSVSEIRNMFTAKSLSDARNSLLLKDKSKNNAKNDSPKGKRKSVSEKQANGNATHVIEYPTIERKGMFSCCTKDQNKDSSIEEEDPESQIPKSESIPDVCEIRPPPRRKNVENVTPPERPPKAAPPPVPRPRSNSFTCTNNELSVVELPNHFGTMTSADRKSFYEQVNMPPPTPAVRALSPPPPLLLPPRKPPLPPAPPATPSRLASIGSPHFQRNHAAYRTLDPAHFTPVAATAATAAAKPYGSLTLQSRHVRSNSETKPSTKETPALSLCSPQTNRKFSNRPDLLNGALGHELKTFSPQSERKMSRVQNHVRFKDDVVEDIPTPPSPPRGWAGGAVPANALLGRAEDAAAALLQRLHRAARDCAQQHGQGGGEDIDEDKFQRARTELTSCAVSLVTASRTLVGALGALGAGRDAGGLAAALHDTLAPLRRLTDLAQALVRHTSSPLQTRNLVLRVHDVTAAFKDLAGAEMAQIIQEHSASSNQDSANCTLEGQLALRAECLANVLATLLRSLRVFSP